MNCDISNNVGREMNFEEEAALFEKEARKLFEKEDGKSEASCENSIIHRGMRIIRKARKEKEQFHQSVEKLVDELQKEKADLRKELEKYSIVKAVADMILGTKG